MSSASTLSDRRGVWAFVLGVIAVTGGVLLHAPMFWMGRNNHFILYRMPIGWDMILGMVGDRRRTCDCRLWPASKEHRRTARRIAGHRRFPTRGCAADGAHWGLMAVLVIALIIDIMKPATLGFTLPGMMSEYHVDKATVSAFPFSALTGTVVGSIIWGWLADIYGRKATILFRR